MTGIGVAYADLIDSVYHAYACDAATMQADRFIGRKNDRRGAG